MKNQPTNLHDKLRRSGVINFLVPVAEYVLIHGILWLFDHLDVCSGLIT